MSMKIDELMIGDWLLYKSDSLDNAFPIQITREMFNKELVVWKDRFEPIPLTPEILKKNGFVHEKQKVIIPNRSQDEVEVEYMYCKGLPCSFDIIHGYLMFNSNINLVSIRMAVNYVHELQHILRLCKIDKEIVV